MGCLDENHVVEFLGGLLCEKEAAEVECHLDGCVACRALVAETVRSDNYRNKSTDGFDQVVPELPGRYTVCGEHGRGGQARIMLAYDKTIGRELVLKELLTADITDRDDSTSPSGGKADLGY